MIAQLLWILLLTLPCIAQAQPKEFNLHGETPTGSIECKASLLKLPANEFPGNPCIFLTNEHCTHDASNLEIEVQPEQWIAVKASRASSLYDLSQLSNDSPELVQQCQQLPTLRISAMGLLSPRGPLRLGGQTNQGGLVVTLPVFPGESGALWQVDGFDVHPGQSGSTVTDAQDDGFLGILSAYRRFQQRALIIPWYAVFAYLHADDSKLNDRYSVPLTLGYSHPIKTHAGKNGHSGSGDTHTREDLISGLQEPLEGFRSSEHPDLVLLAQNGYSIDGVDDVRTSEPLNPIYRPIDGFPAAEVRKDLMSRLSGHYESKDYFGARLLNYGAAEDSPSGYSLLNSERQHLILSIQPGGQIILQIRKLDPHAVGTTLSFETRFEDNDQKMVLSSSEGNLVCENRNFKKLICQSESLLFSLSLNHDGLGQPLMTVRYTRLNADGKFSYLFGELERR